MSLLGEVLSPATTAYKAFNNHKRWRQGRKKAKRIKRVLEAIPMDRTSSKAALIGIVATIIFKGTDMFAPELAMVEGYEGFITAFLMWLAARLSSTKKDPGLI